MSSPVHEVTWERETKTFYYGLKIPLSLDGKYSLFVPKARKAARGISMATVTVADFRYGYTVLGGKEEEAT